MAKIVRSYAESIDDRKERKIGRVFKPIAIHIRESLDST